MKISVNAPCPCHSGKKYKKCCQPFHKGALPSNALALMRSRYSAFALHLVEYIVDTTHPDNTEYTKDTKEWKKGIAEFCDNARFVGLEIIEFTDGAEEAFVTFKAILGDTQFVEKSRFLKVDGKWLYVHYGSGVESPLFGDSDEISQDFSLRTNEFRITTLIF